MVNLTKLVGVEKKEHFGKELESFNTECYRKGFNTCLERFDVEVGLDEDKTAQIVVKAGEKYATLQNPKVSLHKYLISALNKNLSTILVVKGRT